MKATLLYPIGDHQPNEVIDVEDIPPEPVAPTVVEIRQYAAAEGITVKEATRRLAAERRDRIDGPRATQAHAGHPAAPI